MGDDRTSCLTSSPRCSHFYPIRSSQFLSRCHNCFFVVVTVLLLEGYRCPKSTAAVSKTKCLGDCLWLLLTMCFLLSVLLQYYYFLPLCVILLISGSFLSLNRLTNPSAYSSLHNDITTVTHSPQYICRCLLCAAAYPSLSPLICASNCVHD